MESYYFGTYDETLKERAVYNLYCDYSVHIEGENEGSRVAIPQVLFERSLESWKDIDYVQKTFPEDNVLSDEGMEFLHNNAKEAVVCKLIQNQPEMLGDNPANLPSYTSSE